MRLVVCAVPVSSIRAEPSHRSEQVSQLLFGEMGEILERDKEFVKIKVLYDNYVGWCQASQLDEKMSSFSNTDRISLAGQWMTEVKVNGDVMMVPFGSNVSSIQKEDIIGSTFCPEENLANGGSVKQVAQIFLNSPYLWGGRSVFGIDCSGFTQLVFKCLNVVLKRDASEQATQGIDLGFLEEAKCGDLAFFDNEEGKIIHVGIILGTDSIIHASGKVRIDKMDSQGIINRDTGKRTHKLRIIKRIIA